MKIIYKLVLLLFVSFNVYAAGNLYISAETLYLSDIIKTEIYEPILNNLNYGDRVYLPAERVRSFLYRLNLLDGYSDYIKDYNVIRKGQLLTVDYIEDEIKKLMGNKFPDTTFQLEKLSYKNNIYYGDKKSLVITLPDKPLGSSHINISNGFKDYSVYVYIKAFKKCLVADRKIASGEALLGNTREDLVEITNLRDDPIVSPQGYVAKRTIPEGRILLESSVTIKPDLKRGNRVKIRYNSTNIIVEVTGELKEDAYKGKIVLVKNVTSGKIFSAEYVGNGVAVIYF